MIVASLFFMDTAYVLALLPSVRGADKSVDYRSNID